MREAIFGAMMRAEAIVMRECGVWCGGEEDDEREMERKREDLKEKGRLGWRRDFWYGRGENKWKRRKDEREGERWELEIFMPRSSTCTRLTAWSVSELDTAISSHQAIIPYCTGSLEPTRRIPRPNIVKPIANRCAGSVRSLSSGASASAGHSLGQQGKSTVRRRSISTQSTEPSWFAQARD